MITSKIVEIGEMVEAFKEEQLLILFGPQAPAALRSICVIHEFDQMPSEVLQAGGKIDLNGFIYTITQVGNLANKNFETLGHVSIYFRTGENEVLPGSIIVEPEIQPQFIIGDLIKFSIS